MTADHGYDAVVFDLDGTLVDSTDGIVATFEAAYAELALRYPGRDAIVRTISRPLEDQIGDLHIDDATRFINVYRRHYEHIAPARTNLFDGADDLLRDLHATNIPLGIATSKSRHAAEMLLRNLSVYDLVSVCIGREDVVNPKPHPEPLLMAAERLGIPPHRMVYVGDSPFDVEAARRAGAFAIAVTTGAGGREGLTGCVPDALFENLVEVRRHLRIRSVLENVDP